MTIMSEGLPLNSKYIKIGLEEEGGRVSQAFINSHLLYLFQCHAFNLLTVIHLRLCDRKNSLGARGFGRNWTRLYK